MDGMAWHGLGWMGRRKTPLSDFLLSMTLPLFEFFSLSAQHYTASE
jgi:hypothetical protein